MGFISVQRPDAINHMVLTKSDIVMAISAMLSFINSVGMWLDVFSMMLYEQAACHLSKLVAGVGKSGSFYGGMHYNVAG